MSRTILTRDVYRKPKKGWYDRPGALEVGFAIVMTVVAIAIAFIERAV